ncbi:MAG: hypothetical protein JWQ35_1784, partial [Bacteriovoracaceae bacterium]|nr:hypothetical protein [Bacteriovoracaceae bacterium]
MLELLIIMKDTLDQLKIDPKTPNSTGTKALKDVIESGAWSSIQKLSDSWLLMSEEDRKEVKGFLEDPDFMEALREGLSVLSKDPEFRQSHQQLERFAHTIGIARALGLREIAPEKSPEELLKESFRARVSGGRQGDDLSSARDQ